MTDGRNLPAAELSAQALGWLDPLAQLMPETVRIEVSSYVLIAGLVALWVVPREAGAGTSEQRA